MTDSSDIDKLIEDMNSNKLTQDENATVNSILQELNGDNTQQSKPQITDEEKELLRQQQIAQQQIEQQRMIQAQIQQAQLQQAQQKSRKCHLFQKHLKHQSCDQAVQLLRQVNQQNHTAQQQQRRRQQQQLHNHRHHLPTIILSAAVYTFKYQHQHHLQMILSLVSIVSYNKQLQRL